MKIAVIGAGINGVMTAWAFAERGCDVVVYERGSVMAATSSASTKLLHGGLRYLENGEFRLVSESLREREWWMQQASELVQPLRFVIPVIKELSRSRIALRTGLWLYDRLAGSKVIEGHRRLGGKEVLNMVPDVRQEGLLGGYAYTDVQMDDLALGKWAARRAREVGVVIRERCPVYELDTAGHVASAAGTECYDRVINAAGPWTEALLKRSRITSKYRLRLVRGSHLIVNRRIQHAVLMQVPDDKRVVFALPWKGRTMIGTTEVEQESPEPVACTDAEAEYLSTVWARYFKAPIHAKDIIERFAGVRPLVAESGQTTSNTRESTLERNGRVVNIFGGKWTTARVLAQRAVNLAL